MTDDGMKPIFIDLKIRVRFFGRIQKRICDLRSFGSCRIKGTDESTLDKDSSLPPPPPPPHTPPKENAHF